MNELQTNQKVISHLHNMDHYLEMEEMFLAESVINNRLSQKKITGEKINILFVCHRPQIWSGLKTVYEALIEDDTFDVKIVAIPGRKCFPNIGYINEYETEGAEDFFQELNCINGYDYKNDKWVDLRTFKPDYVFFQQPYNIMRPEQYKSWYVSKYAKICYVAYGYEMMKGNVIEGSHPEDFFQNVSFYFSQDAYNQEYMTDYYRRKRNVYSSSVLTGYPKFDMINTSVKNGKRSKVKALWCPRWTEDEGNCNFFDYGTNLAYYFSTKDNMKLMFRPHPQMLVNIKAEDGRKDDRLARIVDEIKNSRNCTIDTCADYLRVFDESDYLIADMTSLMGDYFLTGKPIIYCHKVDCFSEAGRALSEGFYWINNWEELKNTIEMLENGNDPLYEKRQEIIHSHYFLPEGGAGKRIADYIKADAMK